VLFGMKTTKAAPAFRCTVGVKQKYSSREMDGFLTSVRDKKKGCVKS
jgi:hypothetical protein